MLCVLWFRVVWGVAALVFCAALCLVWKVCGVVLQFVEFVVSWLLEFLFVCVAVWFGVPCCGW